MKIKYGVALTVYNDYYIEVEAESEDEAYSIIRSMDPEEIEEKGELEAFEVYKDTIYISDNKVRELLLADRKEWVNGRKEYGNVIWDPIETIYDEYKKMADAKIHALADELKINQLERLILLNEEKMLKRPLDHKDDDYWDNVIEENEKMQAEIDEIRNRLKEGSD